jgi:hypothetical protein
MASAVPVEVESIDCHTPAPLANAPVVTGVGYVTVVLQYHGPVVTVIGGATTGAGGAGTPPVVTVPLTVGIDSE